MPGYPKRLSAVQSQLADRKIDLLFLSYSANLDYMTRIHRKEQNFGNTMYQGDWMTGAWFAPGRARASHRRSVAVCRTAMKSSRPRQNAYPHGSPVRPQPRREIVVRLAQRRS
jgi:Xaa-Pro aminopeptidase